MSLRRAVQGRRLPFDELLKEHREAKEAYLKARVESKEAAAALKASTTPHKTGHMLSPSGKSQLLAQSPPVLKSLSDTNLKDKSHSSSGLSNSLKLDRQLSFNRFVSYIRLGKKDSKWDYHVDLRISLPSAH